MSSVIKPYNHEKRLLFNLCSFLMDKKLTSAGKGVRRPLSIKMKDFKCLFQPGQINPMILASELENIKKEIEDIAKTETNNFGVKLLVINNPEILDNITESYDRNEEIVLIYERLEIKEYLEKLKRGDKEYEKKIKENLSGMEIESIYIVKPKNEGDKYKLVVNEDYKNAKELQDSNLSKTLIKLMLNKEHVIYDKNICTYFNSNPACPIYFQGKYKRTKILEKEAMYISIDTKKYLKICKNIATATLTYRTYTNRLRDIEA